MSLTSSLLASFVGKDYTNFRRARARTQNVSHSLMNVGASARGLSPIFYSHKGHYWRTTRDATVAAFMDAFKEAIMQILHTVMSHVSTQ